MFHEQDQQHAEALTDDLHTQPADALSLEDNGEPRWPDTRTAILNRLTQWIDTVAETEAGRLQIAQMVEHLDGAVDSNSVSQTSLDNAVVNQTLGGLAELTSDLTALRHDLKTQTKQSRTLVEKLAVDTEQIVLASRLAVEHVARLNPPSDRELTRPLVMMVIETDEAILRLQDALSNLMATWCDAPVVRPAPWFARRAFDTLQDTWLSAWNKQKLGISGLAEGLRLTCDRMTTQLRSRGIHRIGNELEAFDPNTMQVLEVQHATQHPPGTVLRVLRCGYRQNDWIIRPAQVTTSSMESE